MLKVMKVRHFGKGFVLLWFALVAFTGLPGLGQSVQPKTEKEKPVELQEILSKLTFTSRINHSFEKLNKQLAVAVQKRGVSFILSDEDKRAIKKAGGNDELIKAIDAAPNLNPVFGAGLSPEESRLLNEQNRLYQIITTNYRSHDPEILQKVIDAAKEFLRRFGDDPRAKPQVDWMRPKIPIWENQMRID